MLLLLYTYIQLQNLNVILSIYLRFFPRSFLPYFQMATILDWVLDFKLETHFPLGSKYETVHTYYHHESLSQRPIKKSEHWQREKKIGDGGFGEVWLERCTKGNSHGHDVRAIKQMEVRRQVDYGRELEAIAKFSHPKACLPAIQRNEHF